VSDYTFGGVFDGHNAVVRAVLADLGEDVGDGFLGGVAQARTEAADGSLVRERRLGTEIRDGHGLFQRQRAGHDFAINGAQLVAGHRPLVQVADALEDGALAVRHVNLPASLEFHFADGQHVLRAIIEQAHNLFIELVNRLAMLRDVHAEARVARMQSGKEKNL